MKFRSNDLEVISLVNLNYYNSNFVFSMNILIIKYNTHSFNV